MRKFVFFQCLAGMFLVLFLQSCDSSHEHADVEVTDLGASAQISRSGNLKNGKVIPLKWAENSSVACFPGTRFQEFEGTQVFYRMTMPANSTITATVIPKDLKNRINIYALRYTAGKFSIPPNVSQAFTCEASYPIYAKEPNKKLPNTKQSVEMVSMKHSYEVLIAVAGAKGVEEGAFELRVRTEKR